MTDTQTAAHSGRPHAGADHTGADPQPYLGDPYAAARATGDGSRAAQAHAQARQWLDAERLIYERQAATLESDGDTPGCVWDTMRRVDEVLTQAGQQMDRAERLEPMALTNAMALTARARRGLDSVADVLAGWRR